MTGRLRERTDKTLLTAWAIMKTIRDLEGKEDMASLMAAKMLGVMLECLIQDHIRCCKLEVAIRHPNWDMNRIKAYMVQRTKNTIKAYELKKVVA